MKTVMSDDTALTRKHLLMTMNVPQYSQWRILVDWVDWRLGKRILHGDLSLLLRCEFYRVPKIAATIAPFIEIYSLKFLLEILSVFVVVRVFLNSLNISSWFGMKPGGGTQKSFIRGGSARRSKPLPFYIPFSIEKIPLSYTFHRKLYPFHIPTEWLLLNFSLYKPLKSLDESVVRCAHLRSFESPF